MTGPNKTKCASIYTKTNTPLHDVTKHANVNPLLGALLPTPFYRV